MITLEEAYRRLEKEYDIGSQDEEVRTFRFFGEHGIQAPPMRLFFTGGISLWKQHEGSLQEALSRQ